MTIFPAPLAPPKPFFSSRRNPKKTLTPKSCMSDTRHTGITRKLVTFSELRNKKAMAAFVGAGFALTTLVGPASAAAELPVMVGSSLQLMEPSNALSLPTWAIHVSSVVEWVTAMALVWQYGEKPGNQTWKGLSWGMVPLLGGALCACTWHFFYNSESLEVLVALQAALTVIGNATMCIAAFRIYKSSQRSST